MSRTTLTLAAAIALLAACNADSTGLGGPPDGAALNQDLATVVADGTADDVELFNAATLSGATLLVDPPEITRTAAFFDAAGVEQETFDPLTTARIELEVVVDGERTFGNWSADIHRERQLTITGLEGTETTRTINGTGESEVTRSRHIPEGEGEPRTYDISCDAVVSNVVVPVRNGQGERWPLSGTITRTCVVTHEGNQFTRTVVVTFNGTSRPDATVNGEPFQLDLQQRWARRRP